jgi:hypothetical protein
VKEEVLARFGELGVVVRGGRVSFRPRLLRAAELLSEPSAFEPIGLDGKRLRIELGPGSLAFTLCQVPVVYRSGAPPRIRVAETGGSAEIAGDTLDAERSAALFGRTGRVRLVEVWTEPGR